MHLLLDKPHNIIVFNYVMTVHDFHHGTKSSIIRLIPTLKENALKIWLANGPVTLGSDYRTILKSDPILLIFQ